MKSHLAITMGDPAGIGPEIIVKACSALSAQLFNHVFRISSVDLIFSVHSTSFLTARLVH